MTWLIVGEFRHDKGRNGGLPRPSLPNRTGSKPVVTDWLFTFSCSPLGDMAPRSYFQLLALQCRPSQGLSPRCSNALPSARPRVCEPVNRSKSSGVGMIKTERAGRKKFPQPARSCMRKDSLTCGQLPAKSC